MVQKPRGSMVRWLVVVVVGVLVAVALPFNAVAMACEWIQRRFLYWALALADWAGFDMRSIHARIDVLERESR